MAISVQDKLSRSMLAFQNKLMDMNVELVGTKCDTVLLEIIEDKYSNEEVSITQHSDIVCVFSFPDDEIPLSLASSQNNQSADSSNVLHLYEVVPITCYFRTVDISQLKVIKGSLVLYKLKLMDNSFQVIPFQITDTIAKGNPSSAILWQEFTVAPFLNYEIINSQAYQDIIQEFTNKNLY